MKILKMDLAEVLMVLTTLYVTSAEEECPDSKISIKIDHGSIVIDTESICECFREKESSIGTTSKPVPELDYEDLKMSGSNGHLTIGNPVNFCAYTTRSVEDDTSMSASSIILLVFCLLVVGALITWFYRKAYNSYRVKSYNMPTEQHDVNGVELGNRDKTATIGSTRNRLNRNSVARSSVASDSTTGTTRSLLGN